MRIPIVSLCIILFTNYCFTQNQELAQKAENLKTKISIVQGGEKLRLLDSLAILIEFNEDFDFEATTIETIDHAFTLDSLEAASFHIVQLMYYKNNIDGLSQEGISIYKKYKPFLKNFRDKKWNAELHIELADSYFFSGQVDSAFIYYEKAKKYGIEEQDQEFLAYVKLCMGSAYSRSGAFTESSQHLKEAYIAFQQLQDTFAVVHSKYLLASLYSNNDFLEEAMIERDEAIQLAILAKDYGKLSSLYKSAAQDDKKKGLEEKRISNLKKALEYAEKSEFKIATRVGYLSSLIIAYSENDSIKKAEEIIASINKSTEIINKRNRVYYLEALQHLAFAKGNHEKAAIYGEKVLQIYRDKQSYIKIKNTELLLSNIYTELNNMNKAYAHFKAYTHIKDSITSAQKTRSLAYYQTLYETEKRDAKIKEQEGNLEVLAAQSKIRTQWFAIAGILAGLLFIVLYVRNRYKRKIERQKAVEKLRTKISTDLHDDVGSLLTGLAMQSEILGKNAPENISAKLERVSDLSRSAMLKMRDAVWVMDARKDNWQSLVDRINEFASEHLGTKELKYNLNHTNTTHEEEIEGVTRQHLYLVTKEAVANILKHSNADTVIINLNKKKDEIALYIKDNGTTHKEGTAGIGISNMKQRIEELKGNLEINISDGYQITVKIPA